MKRAIYTISVLMSLSLVKNLQLNQMFSFKQIYVILESGIDQCFDFFFHLIYKREKFKPPKTMNTEQKQSP